MRRSAVALAALTLSLVACAGSTPPSVTSATAPHPMTNPTPQATMTTTPFDPVSAGATPDGIRRICDEHLANARAILDEIRSRAAAQPSTLTRYARARVGR